MSDPVTDAAGKRYGIRTIGPGHMLDLLEAAGAASDNVGWLKYALMVCSVESIDDVPVAMPRTKDQVRALADRIGNDGIVAVSAAMSERAPSDEVQTAKN